MKRPDHGPRCIACTDPAEAARQIAQQRAELDAEAERGREHRAAGEAIRRECLKPSLPWREYAEVQERMLYHLGAANAIGCSVMSARAHLDRVEAAHSLTRAEEAA